MSTSFATRLKQLRVSLEESQISFSEILDIPTASYRKYEKGEREPTLSVIEKFFTHPLTENHACWLITGEDQPNPTTLTTEAPQRDSSQPFSKDFESKFIQTAKESLLFICHLGWFKRGKDVNFDSCGKILLRDLEPFLDKHASIENKKVG
ncbi:MULTISPECIES: helix-turn-helix domain-containing protein [Pseudoalteromonas]|uniref:Helix-turn-helix transcriptional regulator n=1 Tax=Pseudoalteromonas obscura TaxID=3048491 RepID=A0ABT7ESH6_9GAMM|nr:MULTISPECIES: helix-turn-helix transcriptional regulator [Pseudoalteromonas]MBQ4835336.1 helix-turn-helix transcriptional regulator [Pseudoalteromonas luteoviolacea]MDK2598020.1 helix-turn-helix transcriptional regulator [Pseudoalteromonas sp. P94(2023)]